MVHKYSGTSSAGTITIDPVKQPAIGEIERAQQIEEQLKTAAVLSEQVMGMLTGEGSAESSVEQRSESLQSTLQRNLKLACELRGNLERIAEVLDPTYNKPKAVSGGIR